jgi:hypothetical protein
LGGKLASLPGILPGSTAAHRPSSSHSQSGVSTGSGPNGDGSSSPSRGPASSFDSPQRSSRQPNQSIASSQTPPTPPGSSRGEQTKHAVDNHSIVSGNSGRTMGAANLLLGPRVSLNLRLKAEVHSAEVISKILHEETPKEVPVLHSFVMPHRQSYIPPKQMAPVDPRLEAFDNLQRGGGGNVLMGTDEDGPPSFNLSPSDRPHSASSSLVPIGPAHRQAEVREIAAFLMADLMRAVVAAPESRKQVCPLRYINDTRILLSMMCCRCRYLTPWRCAPQPGVSSCPLLTA